MSGPICLALVTSVFLPLSSAPLEKCLLWIWGLTVDFGFDPLVSAFCISLGFKLCSSQADLTPETPSKSEKCESISQSCLTLCSPLDYSLPGSFVHGILQERTLEWVAIPFSRGCWEPSHTLTFLFLHFREHRLFGFPLMPLFHLVSFFFLLACKWPVIIRNFNASRLMNLVPFTCSEIIKQRPWSSRYSSFPLWEGTSISLPSHWLAYPCDLYQNQKRLQLHQQSAMSGALSYNSDSFPVGIWEKKNTPRTTFLQVADETCRATLTEIWFCKQ